MGIRETWSELDTGVQVAVGLGVAVVGLIVLVPVILVLAAVISTFVLGLGSAPADVPTASFSAAEHANGTVTLTYESGETVQAENVVVQVGDRSTPWRDDDGELTAGDTTTVEAQQGQTISIVWSGDDGTSVLQEIRVEDGAGALSQPRTGAVTLAGA